MIGAPDKYPECCKTGNLFVCRRVEYILYSNAFPPMICRYYIIPARAPDQSGITYTSVGLIHMIPWRRRPVTCPCRVFPGPPGFFPSYINSWPSSPSSSFLFPLRPSLLRIPAFLQTPRHPYNRHVRYATTRVASVSPDARLFLRLTLGYSLRTFEPNH